MSCQAVHSFLAGLSLLCSSSPRVNTKMQQPLTSAWLLGTELHSSHAPPTRFLSLLLFMHESLSFFLLTKVRASQKCLQLLPSIKHSISSPPIISTFLLWAISPQPVWRMIPTSLHTSPLSNYIYASTPLASVLNRVCKRYTPRMKLCPPLCSLLSSKAARFQHCSTSVPAWLGQEKAGVAETK